MTAEILLLPGSLCDNDLLWRDVRGALDPFGSVSSVELTESSIDGMVQQAVDEAADEVILVGLSLGAIVAMAVHRLHAARVRGLALMCTTARPPRPEQRETWTRLAALAVADFDGVVDQMVATMPFGGPDAVRKQTRVREMAERVGSATLRAQLSAQQGRVDERPALAQCRAPVLVVSADGDRVCPLPLSEEIAELTDDSELHSITDCGHLAPIDQPDDVTRLLQEWLPGVVK